MSAGGKYDDLPVVQGRVVGAAAGDGFDDDAAGAAKRGEGKSGGGGGLGEKVQSAEGDTLPPADLKIILLGDSAVGKSKLMERFLMGDYHPRQLSTYALTLFRHTADVDGKTFEVDFWDTAGQERFASMHPSYYFGAHACVLAFDVTRKITYKNLSHWYKELRKYRENIPVILVANKIDVDYKVTQKKFAFAQKKGLPFEFVSAADGTNVVRVFRDIVRSGVEYKLGDQKDFMDDVSCVACSGGGGGGIQRPVAPHPPHGCVCVCVSVVSLLTVVFSSSSSSFGGTPVHTHTSTRQVMELLGDDGAMAEEDVLGGE